LGGVKPPRGFKSLPLRQSAQRAGTEAGPIGCGGAFRAYSLFSAALAPPVADAPFSAGSPFCLAPRNSSLVRSGSSDCGSPVLGSTLGIEIVLLGTGKTVLPAGGAARNAA